MYNSGRSIDLGLQTAQALAQAADQEWPAIIDDLIDRRQLFVAMQQINRLLESDEHAALAEKALQRIGWGWGV